MTIDQQRRKSLQRRRLPFGSWEHVCTSLEESTSGQMCTSTQSVPVEYRDDWAESHRWFEQVGSLKRSLKRAASIRVTDTELDRRSSIVQVLSQ